MKLGPYSKYKSSGVEWIGEVPEHWDVKRLKYLVSRVDDKSDADENQAQYVGMECIESWTGKMHRASSGVSTTEFSSRFQAGDTLFGKLRPYLAKACNPEFEGLCSPELLVLRPTSDVERRFLLYSLLADGFISLIDAFTFGAKMPRANWDDIGSCSLPAISLSEQRAIVDFLDRRTTNIDTLVATKLTLIDRLKEKRNALISRTVTRGLPPNAARAAGLDPHPKHKSSGFEWLGEVPEHWEVKRLRFISPHITVGIVVEPSKYYEDQGIPCLRSLNVRPNALDDRNLVYISRESNLLLSKSILRKGDLVAVRSGQPGTTAVVDDRFDGANCIDLIIIRRPPRGSSTFFSYFLNSSASQSQFMGGAGGAIQQHFNIAAASDLVLVEPPPDEQHAIADFLDLETDKIEEMAVKIETAIERLQEYRTALITAAVTGAIDVREAIE